MHRAATPRLIPGGHKLLRVDLDGHVDIDVRDAQQDVANRPADQVRPHSQGLRPRADAAQEVQHRWAEGGLHQPDHALHPHEAASRAAVRRRLEGAIERAKEVRPRQDADEFAPLHDGQSLEAIGRHEAVRLIQRRL